MTSTILILGQRLKPLDTITRVGQMLGLPQATAYRRAKLWPIDDANGTGDRMVIVPALAQQLGIPYSVEVDEPGSGE
ncbi:MAG: hypothetical protein HGA39_09745 [Coriobacteriia bacterium]|nr:hypothetical protein [Coriobacteriia bacterium]